MAETQRVLNRVPLGLTRAARRRKADRAAYLNALAPLFGRIISRLEPTGFPRITAHLGPHAFDIQAIPDSLIFRKLPCLWVMLTLPIPMPVTATLDLMTRPSGSETFSHFARLPYRLPLPHGLPQDAALHSDSADAPTNLIARHAALFIDPAVKELLIAPKGLRVVILAEEADRGRYLIFRDAELGRTPLPANRVAPLLAALAALAADLTAKVPT